MKILQLLYTIIYKTTLVSLVSICIQYWYIQLEAICIFSKDMLILFGGIVINNFSCAKMYILRAINT